MEEVAGEGGDFPCQLNLHFEVAAAEPLHPFNIVAHTHVRARETQDRRLVCLPARGANRGREVDRTRPRPAHAAQVMVRKNHNPIPVHLPSKGVEQGC